MDYAKQGRRVEGLPVLDVHAHVHPMQNIDCLPLEDQVAEMDRVGIGAAVISSILALSGRFTEGNDEVADATRRYPGRFFGYCHVSANYPELMIPELQRCFENKGFRGIKVYQVGTPYDDARFDPVWDFAAAHKAPVLAHTWAGNLTGFDKAAERFPGAVFMAAHAGSGFAYEAYLQAAKRAPNFYRDITYSREHTNMIEHMVKQIGADRIVWGSDAPTFSMSAQLSKVLFARIADADKRKILYDTAARLFGMA